MNQWKGFICLSSAISKGLVSIWKIRMIFWPDMRLLDSPGRPCSLEMISPCHFTSSIHPLTSAGDLWLAPGRGSFAPEEETRYPFYRKVGGPQTRYVRVRKNSPPPELFFVLCTLSILRPDCPGFAFFPLLYNTHNWTQHKYPCSLTEFEPAIPASERPQTLALDRSDTGIGSIFVLKKNSIPAPSRPQWVARPTALPRPTHVIGIVVYSSWINIFS
jgi:hypothetical protein